MLHAETSAITPRATFFALPGQWTGLTAEGRGCAAVRALVTLPRNRNDFVLLVLHDCSTSQVTVSVTVLFVESGARAVDQLDACGTRQ